MKSTRKFAALVAALALVAACGDDDSSGGDTTSSEAVVTTSTVEEVTTTSEVSGLEQPAIWPAADVVFAAPEDAAADFVTQVLGVPPVLGDFVQGDSRSGEIEVFSPGEGGSATQVSRGVLFLRQIGPTDGWFVIGAGSDNATISVPETLAEVPAGPLTVEGVARGFEASVAVTAFLAGDAEAVLDQEITMAGSGETPEPYSVTLDLSDAAPGDSVALLVQGGVGLETDPGDFGAIVVVVIG